MLLQSGSCSNSSVPFCNNGYDYQCQRGFTEISNTAAETDITWNDCAQECPAGQVCSPEYSGACLAGRYCLSGTESEYQYASQPGYMITVPGATSTSSETACTGTYCPPVSTASTTTSNARSCPSGYYMAVQQFAHSQANCIPNDPTTISTVDSTSG